MEFRPIVKNEMSSGGGGIEGVSTGVGVVGASEGDVRFRLRERLPFEGWM